MAVLSRRRGAGRCSRASEVPENPVAKQNAEMAHIVMHVVPLAPSSHRLRVT